LIKHKIKWTKGNSKLKKTSGGSYNIIGFGIPADHDFTYNGKKMNTCPSALACKAVCYAKQGSYRFPAVVKSRENNLSFSLKKEFVEEAIKDLSKMKKINVVRIHDSGDFYSQEYYDKWCEIANRLPNIIFYAYTKQMNLDLFKNKPVNLRITQSVGGKHDKIINLNLPHARIFSSEQAMVNAGYIDGSVNDLPAIDGDIKIGLVYHGNKNLTDSQERYFT